MQKCVRGNARSTRGEQWLTLMANLQSSTSPSASTFERALAIGDDDGCTASIILTSGDRPTLQTFTRLRPLHHYSAVFLMATIV
jgi:hypothetical protein